jgi:DNA-binding GntR family transcriptional regulator
MHTISFRKRKQTTSDTPTVTPKTNIRNNEVDRTSETRHESLAQYVYSQLRQQIRSGNLGSNERLHEAVIAQRLAVSRTPVREALKRLEAEGMVRFAPPRGFVVAQLSPNQVMELYAMRRVAVGAAARFAAEQASAVEILSMHQMLTNLAHARTADEAAALSQRLHEIVSSAAHNEYLSKTAALLTDALGLLTTTTYSIPGRIADGLKENREIIACISRHDADGAKRAAEAHMTAATEARLKMLFDCGDAPCVLNPSQLDIYNQQNQRLSSP